jgi:hypothetical protein
MTEQQRPKSVPGSATTARIIHAAITAGVVILFAVFLFLRTRMSSEFPAETAGILKLVAGAVLVASGFASNLVRSRIPAPTAGSSRDEWWRANQPKAVVCWAIAEGGGLAALAIGWLIGNTTLLALGAGVALALLFVSRPEALEGSV